MLSDDEFDRAAGEIEAIASDAVPVLARPSRPQPRRRDQAAPATAAANIARTGPDAHQQRLAQRGREGTPPVLRATRPAAAQRPSALRSDAA